MVVYSVVDVTNVKCPSSLRKTRPEDNIFEVEKISAKSIEALLAMFVVRPTPTNRGWLDRFLIVYEVLVPSLVHFEAQVELEH